MFSTDVRRNVTIPIKSPVNVVSMDITSDSKALKAIAAKSGEIAFYSFSLNASSITRIEKVGGTFSDSIIAAPGAGGSFLPLTGGLPLILGL